MYKVQNGFQTTSIFLEQIYQSIRLKWLGVYPFAFKLNCIVSQLAFNAKKINNGSRTSLLVVVEKINIFYKLVVIDNML